jgi:hypothetical protein
MTRTTKESHPGFMVPGMRIPARRGDPLAQRNASEGSGSDPRSVRGGAFRLLVGCLLWYLVVVGAVVALSLAAGRTERPLAGQGARAIASPQGANRAQ